MDHEGNAHSLNKKLLDKYLVYPYSAHDDGLDTAPRWNDYVDLDNPVRVIEVFVDGLDLGGLASLGLTRR